jgi:hypothetical protein
MTKCDGECMDGITKKVAYLEKYLFNCYNSCDTTGLPANKDALKKYPKKSDYNGCI